MSEYVQFRSVGNALVKAVVYEGSGPVDLTLVSDECEMGVAIRKEDAIRLAKTILLQADMITAKQFDGITARQKKANLW